MNVGLNGWQRIWVLASIVWLVVISVYAWRGSFLARPSYQEITPGIRCFFSKGESPDALREAIKHTFRDVSFGEFPKDEPTCKSFFAMLAEKYPDRMDQLRNTNDSLEKREILTLFIKTLAAWFVSIAAVYLIGYGIAWVIRGFKQE